MPLIFSYNPVSNNEIALEGLPYKIIISIIGVSPLPSPLPQKYVALQKTLVGLIQLTFSDMYTTQLQPSSETNPRSRFRIVSLPDPETGLAPVGVSFPLERMATDLALEKSL